jgi:transcriptional regulator with XRE-family HTH domain
VRSASRAQRLDSRAPSFGSLLRQWRLARGLSQLVLAANAEVSGRHLCFLETGRAQPSRHMIQLLASVLDLSLSGRNAMLLAAGYAPAYGKRELAAPELEHVRRALAFILRQQEPFPALVVDGSWDIVMTNVASGRIFGLFKGPVSLAPDQARNALHMICHPNGIRRFIVNWEDFAGPLVQMLVGSCARRGASPSSSTRRGRCARRPRTCKECRTSP